MDFSLPLTNQAQSFDPQYEGSIRALRSAEGRHDVERIREAGQEFEGFFVSYLLKVMRETVHAGLLKNEAGEMFQSFYDQEVGRRAAQAGGFGVGAMVEAYIRQQYAETDSRELKFPIPDADNGSGEGGTPANSLPVLRAQHEGRE